MSELSTDEQETGAQNHEVYFVGPRWFQHSRFSGYDAFHRYIGTYLTSPVQSRWPWADNSMRRVVPWPKFWFSELFFILVGKAIKALYSPQILHIEMSAARHMLKRKGAFYHVLYGETDIFLLGIIGKLTDNYVVASFHDGKDSLEYCKIDKGLLSTLSAAIILGETQREYFAERMPKDRTYVVPHGVDIEHFKPNPKIAKEKICITVGGHTRDHVTLTEAIKLVWRTDPDVRFVAVSPNIGHKKAPLDLEGIEFLSGISDDELLELYHRSAVAIFSFEWAIANNSVLEAMACGVPVVATKIGGVPEYVSAEAGILFEPYNPAEMANAIRNLLNNRELAENKGKAARKAAEKYDYRLVSKQLLNVYEDIALTQPIKAKPRD